MFPTRILLATDASAEAGGGGAGLWLRWVLANALGEALGLGGTALIWALSLLVPASCRSSR